MYFGSFGDQMFQQYQIQLVIHRNLRKIDCSLKLVTSTSQYLYVISVPFKNSVWDGEWTKGNKFPKLENYIRLLLFPVWDKTFSVCVALKTWDKQEISGTCHCGYHSYLISDTLVTWSAAPVRDGFQQRARAWTGNIVGDLDSNWNGWSLIMSDKNLLIVNKLKKVRQACILNTDTDYSRYLLLGLR